MKPICVYSAPGVGSTPLTADLSSKHSIPNCGEVFDNPEFDLNENIDKMFQNKEIFVWALKPHQIKKSNSILINQCLESSIIIGISRRNVVQQIVSFYLKMKNVRLIRATMLIQRYNLMIEQFQHFDQKFVYEDYVYTDTCGIIPSVKPDNYQSLCKEVSTLLGETNV